MPYKVIDRKNGTIMGTYGTLKGAHNKKDKLDNEYGGYRYGVEKAKTPTKSKKSKLKIA
tara:strand:+ start:324 stop:500 length:177 start_codon:yes stop_codon:yes gene_type:complete